MSRLPAVVAWAECLDRLGDRWACWAGRAQRYGRTHCRVWLRLDALPPGPLPIIGETVMVCRRPVERPVAVISWDPLIRAYRYADERGERIYRRLLDAPAAAAVVSSPGPEDGQ